MTQWFDQFFEGYPYLIKNLASHGHGKHRTNPNYTAFFYDPQDFINQYEYSSYPSGNFVIDSDESLSSQLENARKPWDELSTEEGPITWGRGERSGEPV